MCVAYRSHAQSGTKQKKFSIKRKQSVQLAQLKEGLQELCSHCVRVGQFVCGASRGLRSVSRRFRRFACARADALSVDHSLIRMFVCAAVASSIGCVGSEPLLFFSCSSSLSRTWTGIMSRSRSRSRSRGRRRYHRFSATDALASAPAASTHQLAFQSPHLLLLSASSSSCSSRA